MSAAAFNDVLIFRFKPFKRIYKHVKSRKQLILNCKNGRNVHGRRKCVVRGLTHVYIVVWMQKLFPGNFISAVCNYFIGIHIRLCA